MSACKKPSFWGHLVRFKLSFMSIFYSVGRIEEAALLLASIENWNACLEVLHLGQYWSLAARLLHIFGDSVEPVLCEAIWLEAARSLFEAGNRDAANHFCDKIGDKGLELKKEFCHVG